VATVVLSVAAPRVGRALSIETLALGGHPAPGTTAAFQFMLRPVSSDGGAVAFAAHLSTGEVGIWSRPAGGGSFTLQALFPASGEDLRPLAVDDEGAVAFARGSQSFDRFFASALYLPDGNGGHVLAAARGAPAPGGSGATFSSFSTESTVVTDQGGLVFHGALQGTGVDPSNDQGLWAGDGAGGLRLLAREGDPLPGLPGELVPHLPNMTAANDAGLVAQQFAADALWTAPPGGTLALLTPPPGDPAPGSQSGAPFFVISDVEVTGAGVTAFSASTTANEFGLWTAAPGEELQLAFAAGSSVPGAPIGTILASFRGMERNDAGQMALLGSLSGTGVTTSNDGLLLGPDGMGALRIVAREGDPVPGLPGYTFVSFREFYMNEAGDVIAFAFVRTPGGSRVETVLVAAAGEEPQVVVQNGAPLEVAPGKFRTVVGFGEIDPHLGALSILPHGLSDARQFAFEAFFIDAAELTGGVFLVTIPEPATALLLAAGLVALAARRSGGPREAKTR